MRNVLAGRRLIAEDGRPVVSKTFPREPAAVADARHFVAAALEDWKLPELVDAAVLVTSELASNAVLHARYASFRVTVRQLGDDQVRVMVIDRSRTRPEVATPSADEIHGRGLALVDAMSVRWGTEPLNWGKRVWAELEVPPVPEPPCPEVPMFSSTRGQIVYVLLLLAVGAAVCGGLAVHR